MHIYVAKILAVEMPSTTNYEKACQYVKYLNNYYSEEISISRAFIVQY